MEHAGSLRFTDLVRRDLIIDGVEYSGRDEALRSLAGLLVERGFCRDPYIEAILERERAHPSGLPMPGHKIAIPHADSTHVESSALVFARLTKPVQFFSMGAPDEKLDVSMISMFALKEKKAIGDLLETLITVYQDEEVLNEIFEAPDAEKIYELLRHNVHRITG